MGLMLQTLFGAVVKLLLAAFTILYGGLVLMTYLTEGPRVRLRLDWRAPGRSGERLLVWLGVKAVDALRRVGKAAFLMLTDASAEVGEWVIRRRGAEAEAAYRSRFL